MQSVQDKSAAQVKHALAVVEAHKHAAKLNAEAASDRLEARLEKAALHRASHLAEAQDSAKAGTGEGGAPPRAQRREGARGEAPPRL